MSENLGPGFVQHESRLPFRSTVDALAGVIEKAGMTIFARIDHAQGARAVGLTMPPTLVLIYGNARGGTPIMQMAPAAALDLPLRVLVREDDDGRAFIVFHPIVDLLRPFGVPDEVAGRLSKAQQILVDAVSAQAG